MNNAPSRLLFSLVCLAPFAGCYGDKVFVEDGAGGAPTSTSTSGGAPSSGGNGTGGNGTGASGGDAPGGAGGAGTECTSPDQCPTPASECVEPRCDNMVCAEVNKAAGEPCAAVRVCDGDGACVECISNAQCTSPDTCDLATNECAPPLCSNGALDAGETDTDCGGADCPPCLNNDDCLVGSDCVTGYCPPPQLQCSPCVTNNHCPSTDFCTGGGICVPKLSNGADCLNDGECANNACVQTGLGGICCAIACSGPCESCANIDTGLPNGTCGTTLAGLDPKNGCPSGACRTGTCNGSGSCGVSPVNSSCDDGLFCNGSDICDPTGSCSHSGDPCPAEGVPDFNCSESCNEANNNCTGPDPAGTPCTDGFFCTGTDSCNGAGTCSAGTNPCNGPLCTDGCNESADACNALQTAGTSCNANMNLVIGMCSTSGACIGD